MIRTPLAQVGRPMLTSYITNKQNRIKIIAQATPMQSTLTRELIEFDNHSNPD